jgi:hypothetical protein
MTRKRNEKFKGKRCIVSPGSAMKLQVKGIQRYQVPNEWSRLAQDMTGAPGARAGEDGCFWKVLARTVR